MVDPPKLSSPEEWVDLYGDYLFRYAVLRVHDEAVAADLIQDTFVGALQSRQNFAGRSTEKAWLVGTLKHKILDHYSKARRERPLEAQEEQKAHSEQLFNERGYWNPDRMGPKDWGGSPGTILERKAFWEALTRCLAEVSPRDAQVFVLRELEGLSGAEICKMLNISTDNTYVILYRVRMHLRRCLEVKWLGL